MSAGRATRLCATAAAAALAFGPVSAGACPAAPEPGFLRAAGDGFVVWFRPEPAPIAVSAPFGLAAVVCGEPGAPAATGLRVDAHMPDHRHGMNLRPSVRASGGARYAVDGLMFHMPGRWQVVFDVATAGGTRRAVAEMVLE